MSWPRGFFVQTFGCHMPVRTLEQQAGQLHALTGGAQTRGTQSFYRLAGYRFAGFTNRFDHQAEVPFGDGPVWVRRSLLE